MIHYEKDSLCYIQCFSFFQLKKKSFDKNKTLLIFLPTLYVSKDIHVPRKLVTFVPVPVWVQSFRPVKITPGDY